MSAQPPGITFKRDNADVMNNFFVNIVSTSFTEIEEILKTNQEDTNGKAIKQSLMEFGKVEKTWTDKVARYVD